MKRILLASSEAVPFAKTGGLADVIGSLPFAFDKKEYDVRVIMPKYGSIQIHVSGIYHSVFLDGGTNTGIFELEYKDLYFNDDEFILV